MQAVIYAAICVYGSLHKVGAASVMCKKKKEKRNNITAACGHFKIHEVMINTLKVQYDRWQVQVFIFSPLFTATG